MSFFVQNGNYTRASSRSHPFYLNFRYSCPIVLRALLLFEHLDADDDYNLTEKEFATICQEFNKRNMFVARVAVRFCACPK
jgi:hypothetical protein